MTPEEKAKQLIEKFLNDSNGCLMYASQAAVCATICVDTILNLDTVWHYETSLDFWQQVKEHLTKL